MTVPDVAPAGGSIAGRMDSHAAGQASECHQIHASEVSSLPCRTMQTHAPLTD